MSQVNVQDVLCGEAECPYSQVTRIAHVAFRLAQKRRKKLCSVEKSNVLETSQLWKEVVTRISPEYPDVELTHM